MKTYISKGTICIKGAFQLIYAVCKITYQLNEDDSFVNSFSAFLSEAINTME